MRILALAVLLLVSGWTGCASVPGHDSLRATTLRLEFERGVCSGTALSPDVLLSAQHCFKGGGALVRVNGQPVKVVGYGKDKHDLATVRITGLTFKTWARRGNAPAQGDRVRFWGNPGGEHDVFRIGYVSRATTDLVVMDMTICKGDSGAGIFNDRGEVVGVVTGMNDLNGCTFMLAYPWARA